MPMNNWGGITEHMTKKPRKFFSRKKVEPSSQDKENKHRLSTDVLKKANRKKKNKILKEIIFIALFFLLFIVGVFLLFKKYNFF